MYTFTYISISSVGSVRVSHLNRFHTQPLISVINRTQLPINYNEKYSL